MSTWMNLWAKNNVEFVSYRVTTATTSGPIDHYGPFDITQLGRVEGRVYVGQTEPNRITGFIQIPEGTWSGMMRFDLTRRDGSVASIVTFPRSDYVAEGHYTLDLATFIPGRNSGLLDGKPADPGPTAADVAPPPATVLSVIEPEPTSATLTPIEEMPAPALSVQDLVDSLTFDEPAPPPPIVTPPDGTVPGAPASAVKKLGLGAVIVAVGVLWALTNSR